MDKPQNIYDNEGFYNEYRQMRETNLNANELIEIPIMKTMLPNLKGKRILDLGCGNGNMSKYFISQGASYVLATDLSSNMINEAKQKCYDDNITYEVLGMEDISSIEDKFDIVYSSLAFHYIEDFNKLICDISNLLNKDGLLIFSQEHPTVTSSILKPNMKNRVEIDNKRYYLLSDYNVNGKRTMNWNNTDVVKYHRNFSTIINTIINNNLTILRVKESYASDEAIKLVEKYKYQKDRSFFLFVSAKKN